MSGWPTGLDITLTKVWIGAGERQALMKTLLDEMAWRSNPF